MVVHPVEQDTRGAEITTLCVHVYESRAHVNIVDDTALHGKRVRLPPFFRSPSASAGLQNGREAIVVGTDAILNHGNEKGDGPNWVVRAGIPAGHGVVEYEVWLGNSIEQVAGVAEERGIGAASEVGDEPGEEGGVVVELGFDGESVELLELANGGALWEEGEERRRSWVSVERFEFGGTEGVDR